LDRGSFLADHRITLPDEFCQALLEMHERSDGFTFEAVPAVIEQVLVGHSKKFRQVRPESDCGEL
jgi:hypothetical protein